MKDSAYPLSVLVVDDDRDTAESEAHLLSIMELSVRVALGGEEALEQALADPPDVVLLDMKMPGMDGYELARRLRELRTPKRPILVAVTGCSSEEDREKSAAAGIDLHLVKPVDPGILVGMLSRFRRLLSPPVAIEPVVQEAAGSRS